MARENKFANSNDQGKNEIAQITAVCDELVHEVIRTGIDDIIIACTDLSTIGSHFTNAVNIIDSSKALAEAVVRKYLVLQD